MAGGLFSRITTRTTGNTIDGPADDADFDNIINNLLPAKLDDYSVNNAQMDSEADPFPGATQSLPTTLAGELERIRFQIGEIIGEANWYIDPDTDLATTLAHFSDTTTHGTTGDIVGTTDTQTLSAKTLTTPTIGDFTNANHDHSDTANGGSVLNLQASQDTTSGTTSDFTSIPSGVQRITIMVVGVSVDGTQVPIIQLGDSGGFETSSYDGSSTNLAGAVTTTSHTEGFQLNGAGVAAINYTGILTLVKQSGNRWNISGTLADVAAAATMVIGGSKLLSGVLTQIRLTSEATPDTFDNGAWSIMWE